jgi:hypothetical protein
MFRNVTLKPLTSVTSVSPASLIMEGIASQSSKAAERGQTGGLRGVLETLSRKGKHEPSDSNGDQHKSKEGPNDVLGTISDAALSKECESNRDDQRKKHKGLKMGEAPK